MINPRQTTQWKTKEKIQRQTPQDEDSSVLVFLGNEFCCFDWWEEMGLSGTWKTKKFPSARALQWIKLWNPRQTSVKREVGVCSGFPC